MTDVVIVGAKRTALGALLGQFTGVPATTLGATAIKAALEQSGVPADQVSEVLMGCVLPAGLGQAPARQAAIAAGIPTSTGATTINKVCGSGMKAVMQGHDAIVAGSSQVVVAGGMESMTNAPHLLNGSRTGIRFGSAEMLDHMAWDGLTSPYDIAKIRTLKSAFKKDVTITAASSSSINDGAAALVLMDGDSAKAQGVQVLARIVAHSTHSQAPEWFTTAPVSAIQKVLDKAGWKVADVDLFEVNEAFATVAMAPMRELGIEHAKLNVRGGACALGHPIGASGARLIVTLIHALQASGGKKG